MADTTDQQADGFDNSPDEVTKMPTLNIQITPMTPKKFNSKLFEIKRAWSIIQNESFKT